MTTDRRLLKNTIDNVRARRYRRRELRDISNSTVEAEQAYYRGYDALSAIDKALELNYIDIYNNNLYEIYTCNPERIIGGVYDNSPAGTVGGWDIKWVLAPNKEAIKQYPFFDCIISTNDNSTGQAIDAELFIPK